MNRFSRIFSFWVFVVFVSFGFLSQNVIAASFFSSPSEISGNEGDQVQIAWFVNTENLPANALQGTFLYLPEFLRIDSIETGNSIVSFWIQKPTIDEKAGVITFSGLLPGGYSGTKGSLFSIVATLRKSGNTTINTKNTEILLSDGNGTAAPTTENVVSISVSSRNGEQQKTVQSFDIFAPENFSPTIVRDPNIFNGKYFLVFETKDKDSGIAYYEVCEGRHACEKAESPYLLRNQLLTDEIAVKAYDNNKNYAVAMVSPQNKKSFISFLPLLIVIGFGFISMIVFHFIKRKK